MISCVAAMSHPYVAPPTRNSSVGERTASGIDAVEAKEVERVGNRSFSDGDIWTSGDDERAVQLLRQRRAEIDRFSSHRMTEDQPRRMQKVSTQREPHQLAASASAVSIITDDRMPDRGEVYSDLMRASRKEVSPKQISGIETREPCEIRPRRPSSTDDCHALSVSRIAGDRLFDGHPFFGDMTPGERGVSPNDLPRL